MYNGYIPELIDHRDGNTENDRIENLRVATHSENRRNSRKPKNNTSGVKGVSWHKPSSKWWVTLSVEGKKRSFGLYHDINVAKFVVETMRHKYHGQFARSE
jgi:hypothetical protein